MRVTHARIELLNKLLEKPETAWSIYALHQSIEGLTYPAVFNFVKELETLHYLSKIRGKYRVSNMPAIINSIAQHQPFHAKEKVEFKHTGELFEKQKLVKNLGLDYAFTLFTASELIRPYVMTTQLHAYVNKADIPLWKEKLFQKNARPTLLGEGNLSLLPVEEKDRTIPQSWTLKGYRIAPRGTLLADLQSFGGLGQEQAQEIMNQWIKK